MTEMTAALDGYFDPDRGRALLHEFLFDALLAAHRGAHGHPSMSGRVDAQHSRLRELGVLTGSGVHISIRDGLTAVIEATAEVNLRVSSPLFSVVHRAWLLPAVAGVAEYGELVGFAAMATPLLLDRLADQLQVGPRHLASGGPALRVSRRVVDALLAGQENNRVAAAELVADRIELPMIAEDLRAGHWQTWHAESTWFEGFAEDRRRHGRALIVIDTPSGFIAAHPVDGGRIDLGLLRPEEVWRRLLRLMPPEESLVPRQRTSP